MKEKYFNINASGNSIRCKMYSVDLKAVRKVILYGHGFGGHKDNKAAQRFAEYVLKKRRDVVIITYDAPCHGDDVKKKLSLEDCGAYIGMVTAYAAAQYHTDDICVFATSFGGYQFLKYLSEHGNPYRKIALRCPAVNMFEVLSESIMSDAEKKALSRNKAVAVGFDRKINITRQFLNELQDADITQRDYRSFAEDILILHGTEDEIVPFRVSQAFADSNNIRFISVEHADHRFINPDHMIIAIKEVAAFFDI